MQISGRKLLEAAKRVGRQQAKGEGGTGEGLRGLTDAQILELIAADAESRKQAHRERMRRYYQERVARMAQGKVVASPPKSRPRKASRRTPGST